MSDTTKTKAQLLDELHALRQHTADLEAAQRRFAFLAEAGDLLAASLDYQTTLAQVARLAVPHIADWCAIDLIGADGALQRLAMAHIDPDKVAWGHELQRRYPPNPDAPTGVYNVLRTGRAEFYPEITDAMLVAGARDPEQLQIMREIGFTSVIIAPLRAHSRTLGAISFVSADSGRRYGSDDMKLAEELARRAALAIDNARLYREMDEQREWLSVTLTSIGDAVIATDIDCRVTFMNTVAEALTGWPLADALGQDLTAVFRIINEETRGLVESPAARVVREGAIVGLANHTLLIARDGSERPIDDSGAPIRDARGRIIGTVLVFRDVTERKRAEHTLARYQMLSEHANDSILFVRRDGRIIEANRAAVASYGYPHDDLVRLNIADIRSPDTRPEIASQMAQASGVGALFETEHIRKNGQRFPVEVSSHSAMIDSELVFLSIIRDITKRKRDEAAQQFLANASTVLGSSLDYETTLASVARLATPDLADWCAVHILDAEGVINRLAVAHVDPEKEALARDRPQRYSLDPNAQHIVPQVVRSGRPEIYVEVSDEMLAASARDAEHLKLLRALGFSSYMCVPMLARGRTLGAITFVLAQPQRRYTSEDLRLAEQLAQRAALAVDNTRLYRETQEAVHLRDIFLSVASHELKTPLTSLLGQAQMLERRMLQAGGLQDRDRRSLQVVVEQARRLRKMIDALLDISRIQTGQLAIERTPVDLAALVRRVSAEVQTETDRHTIICADPEIPLLVEGEELRLEQVFQNLIQNAIKYSPTGGVVTVRVRLEGAQVCIDVIDEGLGIPASALPQLFQRFYRAENADDHHISGMGIGLYVVREIVMLHGGTVDVASQEGRGSTFTVCLPLLAPASEDRRALMSSGDQRRG